jgi:chemotaxis methyl-accepting protein methylase
MFIINVLKSEVPGIMIIRKLIDIAKKMPLAEGAIKTQTWQDIRHRITLLTSDRTVATFTGFFRLLTQFEALSGPVLDTLFAGGALRPLKVIVIGCSKGVEAYSIASVLKDQHPGLGFKVFAYDVNNEVIEKAKSGRYAPDEVNTKRIPASYIDATFDRENDLYLIKKAIAETVSFDIADALDPNLNTTIGTADIVFAQNFLVHMKPKTATRAFNNIYSLLNPKAVLFVDGMDVDLRYSLTRKYNLDPLMYKIEEIHIEARVARGVGWPYSYWGLEPFSTNRRGWQRRYSTIFVKK